MKKINPAVEAAMRNPTFRKLLSKPTPENQCRIKEYLFDKFELKPNLEPTQENLKRLFTKLKKIKARLQKKNTAIQLV